MSNIEGWWIKDLERLRKEQNPQRDERPSIHLPLHPPMPATPRKAEPEEERGVCIIDFSI